MANPYDGPEEGQVGSLVAQARRGKEDDDDDPKWAGRKVLEGVEHGDPKSYRKGCRCKPCTKAYSAYAAQWRGDREPGSRTRGAPRVNLKQELEEMLMAPAVALVAFDDVCGSVLADTVPDLANDLDKLARKNPRVKKILERMVSSGVYAVLFAHLLKIVAVVLVHHGPIQQGTPLDVALKGLTGTEDLEEVDEEGGPADNGQPGGSSLVGRLQEGDTPGLETG